MSENKIGYRGSKSFCCNKHCVKEQRVDGSYLSRLDKLRYTLMGGESRYQVKIPSKQLNTKKIIIVLILILLFL